MAVVETISDDSTFPNFQFEDSSSQNSNTKATFSKPTPTVRTTTTTTAPPTTSTTKKTVKPAIFLVTGDTNPLKFTTTADKREDITRVTKQKLNSAYIFNQPNLKIEEQVISTPSPRPMLEKPYQLTLQTGSDSLPLVGIYQKIAPTDSTLIEMSNGRFGAKIFEGDIEEEFEDEDEEMFEFRPYKHKPLIKVKTMLTKKSNESKNKKQEIEKQTLKIRTIQKMQI